MSLCFPTSLPRSLFAILLIAVGLSAGCDSGGPEERGDPAPVSIESISVSNQGEATVEWTSYEAENFEAYAVYRSVPGMETLERVDVLSSPGKTTFTEQLPGFVGGPLRYRVDVRTTDTLTMEGTVTRYDVPASDASVDISADGVLTVSWQQCQFQEAFASYSVQRRISGEDSFREIETIRERSDTTAIFEAGFGASHDYRVVTQSRIDRRSIAGEPVLEAGIGQPFNPHTRTKYTPIRDEIYVVNDQRPYVLRLDAESLSRKDSASFVPQMSQRIGSMIRFNEDGSTLKELDPETFEVLDTYSTSSFPGFDRVHSIEDRVSVPGAGLIAYTTFTPTREEVKVYDLRNEAIVGQTEEGRPARTSAGSYFGNHILLRKNGFAIYSIGENEVRRIGELPTDRPKFQWLKGPDQTDWFAEYDSGELTIRRAHDFSIVRQFPLNFSLTHLRYDKGSGNFWAVNEYESRLYVFSPESGTVLESLPLFHADALRYSVKNGTVFYDGGRVLSLDLQ